MDKSWITKHRLSQDYMTGIKDFLDFAFSDSNLEMIKCPCQRCCLVKYKPRTDVECDLICHGFVPTYTNWYLHGEELDFHEHADTLEYERNVDHVENQTRNLLGDAFPSMNNSFNESASMPTDHSKQKEAFDDLLGDCNEALYEGCQAFSKLSFMVRLYHIKCMSRISDKGMSLIIELLKEAFEHAKLPDSFNDMKKIIRKLGFKYETIHVCPNDCMLYWGDDASRHTCKVCGSSRWKTTMTINDSLDTKKKKKKQQAAKVLRYFPLKPRLQRFFMSSKTAQYMRWHADSQNRDGRLRHPRDGKAWKTFNQKFPEFASDPRNVRLGLATDGFNPFGSMSTSYSVWPVFLIPYNLPPWMSMKQTSMILSMIIPGKHMPGNDIDIYLQPLIQELRELWYDGVSTFDVSLKEIFCMRAVLLWTISDFPGLGNLSGWNIHTGLACPSCNYDAVEFRLRHGKKNCYMGHRRFLPQNHSFRKDKQHFDGCIETRVSPNTPSGTVILQQLENVEVTLGKKVNTGKKRRRVEAGKNQWKKSSIFFELPYWKDLLLRHNLDLMHIEKNVFDNLIFTLLDDKGKSKDNLSARKDLQELGIREELWADENGRYLPACFTMTTQEKNRFLNILKSVKLPDGYSSNISACADLNQRKMVGLKSHDCHILMGQLLSIALRNVLPQEVSFVITELCQFFREISSKVLDIKDLDKLQEHIVLTLCHMEMIFPPSFFTVMVHLIVHLTEEVKLGGPVQFRWMYPIERTFGSFKYYVRNRARPEGSICEQYIADECLLFCSMYLDEVETRFNRVGRVDDHPVVEHDLGSESQIPLLFPSLGRPVGVSRMDTLNPIERQQAHRYILVNSSFLDDYREIFKSELRRSQLRRRKRGTVIDIDRHVHLHFSQWLKQKVEKNELDGISADIRFLASGPSDKVLQFSAYNINGFKFRIIERDHDLKTQNSGVFVSAETISYASSRDLNPRAGDVSYYGKLTEILELNYYDSFRIVLFKCKWVDTRDARGYKKDAFGHTLVNFSRLIHSGNSEEDEPYVLASQAKLIYYVDDPQEEGWSVVVHVNPRDLYDMGDPAISNETLHEIITEAHFVERTMLISDNVPDIRLVRQLEDLDNSQISHDVNDNMEV